MARIWGSAEAQLAYQWLVAEFLAGGRVLTPAATSPQVLASQPSAAPPVAEPAPEGLTVVELVTMYVQHCRTYYRDPDGKQTSTYGNALQAARALRPFDDTTAALFGPKKLGMIRGSEAANG